MKYLFALAALLLPAQTLAHSGHEAEGMLSQFLHAEHAPMSIALMSVALLFAGIVYSIKKVTE